MAPKTRAKRGSPGLAPEQVPAQAPVRTTRSTRQTTNQNAAAAGSSPSAKPAAAENRPDEAASIKVRASLSTDPVARRGARHLGPTPSLASIATVPPRADDASDSDEEYGEGEGAESGNPSTSEYQDEEADSEASEGNDQVQAITEAHRQVMILSYVDLAKASKELMRRLQNPDHEDLVFRGILTMKRKAFFAVREIYESALFIPYAEWDWINILQQQQKLTAEASKAIRTVLVFANVVTAMDLTESIQHGENDNPLPFLETLDNVFPKLFTLSENDNKPCADLALDIRTLRWIETLAVTKSNVYPREIAATVFCEPSEKAFEDIFTEGPYKALGGLRNEYLTDVCSERIQTLFMIIRDKNTGKVNVPFAIPELRSTFPLKDLLDRLREWLLRIYSNLASRVEHVQQGWKLLQFGGNVVDDADVPYAEEDIAESMVESVVESVVESQEIVRLRGTEHPSSSLYQDLNSVRQLNQGHPSERVQAGPFPNAALRQASPDSQNGADDEDDNEYETDTRPVDKGKRAALAASLQGSKRQRVDSAQPSSSARHSTDMPPPPRPNRAVSSSAPRHQEFPADLPPSSSDIDLEAIQAGKRTARAKVRQAQPASYKQRHAWSDHDAKLLCDLVRKHKASWSAIEHNGNHLFERSRNHQAYRDKARNMKVDILSADAVLPLGFDLVRLSSKEIKRVVDLGKNPDRVEADVDGQGVPINTDLDPPMPRPELR